MKIFITGGSGVLGTQLVKYCEQQKYDVYAPSHEDMDIEERKQVWEALHDYKPNIIIHCAAIVDLMLCERNSQLALDVNVQGTVNLIDNMHNKRDTKFVYISSEYVFDGRKGYYHPIDPTNPINVYGKSKAAAEYIVSLTPNYQIVRVPFIKKLHPKVFVDQICSRYFVNEVPEKIIRTALEDEEKIVHISTNISKNLYRHYIDKGLKAEMTWMTKDQLKIIPINTSLINTCKY